MAIGFFSNAKPAPTTEEHVIPQGIREIQLKLPPTRMLANFHAALYGFDQFCLMGGKKKEEKEDMRMWRTGTSQVVCSLLPSRSLVIPVCYPRNLQKDPQAQCESASLQQWQCWSSQLVLISRADHDEGSPNCTLLPSSRVFSWSCWSTAHMRAELGCEKDSATCCSAQDDLFPFERQELIPLMYPPHIVIFKGNKINFMFITS
ncbi:uncharacterized protein LOC129117810 isoform X1 [Agelaius phoeniceus]|uniref:uncharacterized protein LOC129117810 isoform X1 n=1 Tax=Agelaius phoeniceus TaxID=39638 RepID=UPI004054CC1E